MERTGGDQAIVFAGRALLGPACACGVPDCPLKDAGESFQRDDAHALRLGRGDDLMGKLVVDGAHATDFLALALAHGADLLSLLELLPPGVEPAAPRPLHAPVPKETMALADHMHHSGPVIPRSTP